MNIRHTRRFLFFWLSVHLCLRVIHQFCFNFNTFVSLNSTPSNHTLSDPWIWHQLPFTGLTVEIWLSTLQCMKPSCQTQECLENWCVRTCVHSRVQLFATPRELQPPRLLYSWDFRGKNTGVGSHLLLQGILPTQGPTPCLLPLLHCRQILPLGRILLLGSPETDKKSQCWNNPRRKYI